MTRMYAPIKVDHMEEVLLETDLYWELGEGKRQESWELDCIACPWRRSVRLSELRNKKKKGRKRETHVLGWVVLQVKNDCDLGSLCCLKYI